MKAFSETLAASILAPLHLFIFFYINEFLWEQRTSLRPEELRVGGGTWIQLEPERSAWEMSWNREVETKAPTQTAKQGSAKQTNSITANNVISSRNRRSFMIKRLSAPRSHHNDSLTRYISNSSWSMPVSEYNLKILF